MSDAHQSLLPDTVIVTRELERRPSREPDYEAENRALRALAETLATKPDDVLHRVVDEAIVLTQSDSVGISLLEPGGEYGTFRWVAATGAWAPYRDGKMPREASPCGTVIDQQRPSTAKTRVCSKAFRASLARRINW